jgi:hypothetical protein
MEPQETADCADVPQMAQIFFLFIIRAIRALSAPSAVNREWNHKGPLIARISTDCADISFNHLCYPCRHIWRYLRHLR